MARKKTKLTRYLKSTPINNRGIAFRVFFGVVSIFFASIIATVLIFNFSFTKVSASSRDLRRQDFLERIKYAIKTSGFDSFEYIENTLYFYGEDGSSKVIFQHEFLIPDSLSGEKGTIYCYDLEQKNWGIKLENEKWIMIEDAKCDQSIII